MICYIYIYIHFYTKKNMNLATRYLNLQSSGSDLLSRLVGSEGGNIHTSQSQSQSHSCPGTKLNSYDEHFSNYSSNPNLTDEFIKLQITNYVEKNYSLINVSDVDVNYYIERINLFVEKKFKNIIEEMNLTHIIGMCDYFSKKNIFNEVPNITNHYLHWRNEYYRIVWEYILCGRYKVFGSVDKESLPVLIENNWDKIKFDNLIEFTNSLNKIKFLSQNVDEYIKLISNKFDITENLTKLMDYVQKKLQYKNQYAGSGSGYGTDENGEETSDDYDDYEKELSISKSKYNFRFVIDCMKSNGYLLFEEYNKIIRNKYKKTQPIETIRTDKRIVNYYIYMVSKKDSNSTNRKVNELLISMKNYINDIEESYYNNIAYRKITVRQESEKYKSIDLSSYNRENSTFTLFKYSNNPQSLSTQSSSTQSLLPSINELKLCSEIEPYFDIYKSYYNSRYPDRELEFDLIKSSLIVKMVFGSNPYYVHLALIQYIVMDKLFKVKENEGLGIKEISSQTGIEVKNLQQTINSLLHIKLIKHSANTSNISDMKFFINYDFSHPTNKISIGSLVIPKEQEVENERKLMYDRNTIILSNLYDYVKKNRTFVIDGIYNELSKKKIPFKIELEQVISAIKIMVEKEDIVETNEKNVKTYKYCE